MNSIKDIIRSDQFQNLSEAGGDKPGKKFFTAKSQYKLYAIFKVAVPHASWHWDPLWLMDYYKTREGLLFNRQWEAIQYKIDEIVDRCKIIMVYDNRESAAHPVIFKIRNGIVIVNNMQIENPYEIGRKWVLTMDVKNVPRG